LKYLDRKKIKYEFEPKLEKISIQFISSKQINEFQSFVFKNKAIFERFEHLEPTLDDIYKKLIIKGSVDTMDEQTQK